MAQTGYKRAGAERNCKVHAWLQTRPAHSDGQQRGVHLCAVGHRVLVRLLRARGRAHLRALLIGAVLESRAHRGPDRLRVGRLGRGSARRAPQGRRRAPVGEHRGEEPSNAARAKLMSARGEGKGRAAAHRGSACAEAAGVLCKERGRCMASRPCHKLRQACTRARTCTSTLRALGRGRLRDGASLLARAAHGYARGVSGRSVLAAEQRGEGRHGARVERQRRQLLRGCLREGEGGLAVERARLRIGRAESQVHAAQREESAAGVSMADGQMGAAARI